MTPDDRQRTQHPLPANLHLRQASPRAEAWHLPQAWLLSQQRLDPLGALAAWPLAPLASIVLFAFACYSAAVHAEQTTNSIAAVAALACVAASFAVHMLAARPASARYSACEFSVVVALAGFAAILQVASTWGANELLQDDYGQIVLAVLLAAGAPYRPALQLALSAVAAAVLVGALAVAQEAFFVVTGVPSLERVVVAVVPVLGLGLAGAVYANQLVRAVMAWQSDLADAVAKTEPEVFDGLARTVQQEHVAALSDEVLPFLARISSTGALTAEDTERARRLARAVRATLVAELNHSWLEQLSLQYASRGADEPVALSDDASTVPTVPTVPTAAPLLRLSDESRRASRMPGEQRSALAALLSELFVSRELAASALSLDLMPDASNGTRRTVATLRAQLGASTGFARGELRPYLHVLQLVSDNAHYSLRGGKLHVLFSYEHDPSGR